MERVAARLTRGSDKLGGGDLSLRPTLGCLALMSILSASSRLVPGQDLSRDPSKQVSIPISGDATKPRAAATFLRGLNAGVTFSGVHDSSVGWYNVVTPVVSYSFSPRYYADASMSIYPYRYTQNQDTAATSANRLVFDGGDVGDMLIETHAIFDSKWFRSISTASMTIPTGERQDGLGTGRVTFSLDNRFERYFGQTGLVLDLGGGDSSGLTNRLVTEEDTSLGPLAHFQAGFVTWLPNSISIQSVAYEDLPLGDQKIYETFTGRFTPTRTVVTGRRVTEDNGFTTTVYVPLTSQWMLTGSYNRSLRLHLDTFSTGVTFVWKGFPIRRRESLIDKAMRIAESGASATPPTHP